MKKIFFFAAMVFTLATSAQTITDTGALRTYINANIVTNGTKAITATKLNYILNGYLNTWPNNSMTVTSPLTWNPVNRTLGLTGYNATNWNTVFNWYLTNPLNNYVPITRTITINGVTQSLSGNRSWTITTGSGGGDSVIFATKYYTGLNFIAKPTANIVDGRVLTLVGGVPQWEPSGTGADGNNYVTAFTPNWNVGGKGLSLSLSRNGGLSALTADIVPGLMATGDIPYFGGSTLIAGNGAGPRYVGGYFMIGTDTMSNRGYVRSLGYLTTETDPLAVKLAGAYNDPSWITGISAAKVAQTASYRFVTDTEKSTWNAKQAALVSGTNIKTINSTSLLGSGDIAVQPTLVSGTNIKTVDGFSIMGSGNLITDNIFTKNFTGDGAFRLHDFNYGSQQWEDIKYFQVKGRTNSTSGQADFNVGENNTRLGYSRGADTTNYMQANLNGVTISTKKGTGVSHEVVFNRDSISFSRYASGIPSPTLTGVKHKLVIDANGVVGHEAEAATNTNFYLQGGALEKVNDSTITTNIVSASDTGVVTPTQKAAWDAKQAALVSGSNIKTVNGNTLVGSGDVLIYTSKTASFQSPTATENVQMEYTPVAKTVTHVVESVGGTSPSVTYQLNYASARNGTPTTIFASGRTVTTTSGTVVTSFASGAIPANSYIWITTTAVSGTVDRFEVTLITK